MQIGTLVDYCIDFNARNKQAESTDEPRKRKASQAEINAFFG